MTATGQQTPAAMPALLPPALAAELGALHPDQRAAATHHTNIAVLAGPGAGKTRALVARVGYLLATTSRHRGVAALTYTETAAHETTVRLHHLGLHPGRRLSSTTVHAFCLHHILHPYGRLIGDPLPDDLTIPDASACRQLWDTAAYESGLDVNPNNRTTLERLRRLIAAGEPIADYPREYPRAVRRYEQLLRDNDTLDFEAMTIRALDLLRESRTAREQLVARFPNFVVDEYQDLGPVLHALVLALLDAGVGITAVGDPDQVLYAYQGASPRYLTQLGNRPDFRRLRLRVNYRSGSALVAAGHAVLGEDRGYHAAPGRDDAGTVTILHADGDEDAHAARTVEVLTNRLATGTPPEDIAVLYRSKGPLLNALTTAIQAAQIPLDSEKQRRRPSGPLADLIAACTTRRLTGPLPGPTTTDLAAPRRRTAGIAPARTLRELAATWHRQLQLAHHNDPADTHRALSRRLASLLDAPDRETPSHPARIFLAALWDTLGIAHLADHSPDQRDRDTAQALADPGDLTMAELAGGQIPGHIALTTYHSAKGREFHIVILPGLVEGLLPHHYPGKPPAPKEVADARRAFYVALTRAKDEAVLIGGNRYTIPANKWYPARPRDTTRSRFVDEVEAQLPDTPH
ncbi:ATP-dependent helicase [Streptomyces sp. SID13726]|uniref:ATP-dependent helicase n=1 Tax=Streptomyces sp. SID13726 TaxID=2706058 RepID=UPI0013B700E6|nr:ATP-dependent helicase [Streptomyces sp. SID13726]NEB04256.1 ATP-dependent helicase [Streptomyces sp. SID13726]